MAAASSSKVGTNLFKLKKKEEKSQLSSWLASKSIGINRFANSCLATATDADENSSQLATWDALFR